MPLATGALVALAALLATPRAGEARPKRFCSDTALLQLWACEAERGDDRLSRRVLCLNLEDEEERSDCYEEARDESRDDRRSCREQYDARLALCDAIGEDRYDPSFDPADFVSEFAPLAAPNPYLPLRVGNRWVYGGDEDVVVEVLDRSKDIEGVTCVVVNDRVEVDGTVVEDTDDWFAQANNGDVYYCGEEVKDYEIFAGDDPVLPELVAIDGSFKVGRDGDKPGVSMPGSPMVGATYRQEWSPGNAEDAATVLSTNYSYGSDPNLDTAVPQALAELLCSAADCVVTREFTPLDPQSNERKYFARGIGFFFALHVESGETLQLTECNMDPRCALLPAP
jgi:hypothetical protein